ncbi:MAG: hypothetical protein COT24_03260 [Candidatus Kerfeldbacteria bacterium CG08_land_8_20_14_0_20_40_16]|uniref:Sulfotransferase domain-containing protein n=1 Tax=Candidatus Kerfeldbacteria bacterium CG08_land_8_20_14_0_20_40_16 TaxID=2014244 RepID=A0A2H0YVG1_9BACT|nr:MAG: hypothetical protein COT24_03260 [Candidatus Kerfeldbacteria bacterium CG08_land_8_20_14_0_20_40_16]
MKKTIKIIYIPGLGRSGSTLIELLLSYNKQVFGLDELYNIRRIKKRGIKYSCGSSIDECDFWRKTDQQSFLNTIIKRISVPDYLRIPNYLFNPLAKKCPFKQKMDCYQVYSVINKGVANFFSNRVQSGKQKSYFVTLLKWIFMNSLINRFIKKHNINSIQISYNQLCKDPDKYINELENFLNIKIPSDYFSIIKQMEYHSIGGNRISLRDNRLQFPGIIEDIKWKSNQHLIKKLLGSLITYPFNKKWVYNKS